jgi:hypothetical protein
MKKMKSVDETGGTSPMHSGDDLEHSGGGTPRPKMRKLKSVDREGKLGAGMDDTDTTTCNKSSSTDKRPKFHKQKSVDRPGKLRKQRTMDEADTGTDTPSRPKLQKMRSINKKSRKLSRKEKSIDLHESLDLSTSNTDRFDTSATDDSCY